MSDEMRNRVLAPWAHKNPGDGLTEAMGDLQRWRRERGPQLLSAQALELEVAQAQLHGARLALRGPVEWLKAESSEMRKFRMVAYTGAEFGRAFGRAVVDISGIERPEKLPILLNHCADDVVGYATSSAVDRSGYVLEGVVSRATAAGRQVAEMSDEGFPFTASLGVYIMVKEDVAEGRTVEVNGREHRGPLQVWRRTTLYETSFLTANPADPSTTAAVMHRSEALAPLPLLWRTAAPSARMAQDGTPPSLGTGLPGVWR